MLPSIPFHKREKTKPKSAIQTKKQLKLKRHQQQQQQLPPPPPLYLYLYPPARLSMSTAARRRLMRDFRKLQNDPPSGVSGAPMDNNIMLWQAVIFGYALCWQ